MDKEQMITELVNAPKYKERADIRTVIDEAVAQLREATSKINIKEVLDALKERLEVVLNQPEPTRPAPEPIRGVPRNMSAVKTAIDALPLQNQAKEKLKQMFEGYDESVATAKEIDPRVQEKSLSEVYAAFAKLGINKLKEIAEFGKPTLLVTPKNSFLEKKAAIDANRKYDNQAETYVWTSEGSPFQSVTTPTETVISIVDGQPHIPHIAGIAPNSRYDERKAAFKTHFARKGMRLINAHEAAVLEQLSLRDYKRNGKDVGKIVDYYQGNDDDTISCLDDEYLTDSSVVASACFRAAARKVSFNGRNPVSTNGDLRGRPSVQVLKY